MTNHTRGMLRRGAAAIRTHALVPLGRRLGAPHVQLTSPITRGGNFLYDWMWAYRTDSSRRPARVLYQSTMVEWLAEFPMLSRLTIAPGDVPRWLTEFHGVHKDKILVDFTRGELNTFCRALCADSSSFRRRMERASREVTPRSVVLNVRRGDYYAFETLRAVYGLDIEAYVAAAMRTLTRLGHAPDKVIVVSDDVGWCLEHLRDALPVAPMTLEYRESMFDDLAMLAVAPTIILANSTFSFWGAHLAAAQNPGVTVLAPPYHFIENGVTSRERFDPSWRVIAQ